MYQTPGSDDATTVVCLHSSGASGKQWSALRDTIGARYDVLTPNLIGYGPEAFEPGRPLAIDDEVGAVATHIRAAGGRAHLVGHSYGGAVATHLALRHPELVASLALYEPVLMSMLFADDPHSEAVAEVSRVADSITSQLDTIYGRWQGARDFVNYWSGGDAWSRLDNSRHARLASQMPKVAAEFRALVDAGTFPAAVGELRMPVRLLCGTATRASARRIAELFAAFAPVAAVTWLEGQGHMAPITNPDAVNPLLVAHLLQGATPRRAAVA